MLTAPSCTAASFSLQASVSGPSDANLTLLTGSHHHSLLSGWLRSSSPGNLATGLLTSHWPAISWHRLTSWTWPLTPSSPCNCRRRRRRLLHFRFHTLLRLSSPLLHHLLLKSLLPGKLLRRSLSCRCSHLQRLEGWCRRVILISRNWIRFRVYINKQEYYWVTGVQTQRLAATK